MNFIVPQKSAVAFTAEVTRFVVERRLGTPCFVDWPVYKVFTYAGFCLMRRMCACAVENGRLVTVAFGWPGWGEHIEARAAAGAPEFTWSNPIQGGDSIFIAEVIGERSRLRVLWDSLGEWCPDIDERRIFTYRRDKLVELPQALMRRLIYGQQPKHS